MMVACMAVLLAGYVILTWPKKVESEAPTVIVESAEKGDVENPIVRSMGAHSMVTADVDGDGRDEVMLGSCMLDDKNGKLYAEYKKLADNEKNIIFGGVLENISIMIWMLLLRLHLIRVRKTLI